MRVFLAVALVAMLMASPVLGGATDYSPAGMYDSCAEGTFGQNSSCLCNVPSDRVTVDNPVELVATSDYATSASRAGNSRLVDGNLVIFIEESVKYFDGVAVFADAPDSQCADLWNFTAEAALSDCNFKLRGEASFADVVTHCNMDTSTETNGDAVTTLFKLNFAWTNTETVPDGDRAGTGFNRTLRHLMPIHIKVPNTVEVELVEEVRVFAPVLLLSALTKQVVVGDLTNSATVPEAQVEIITSLQYPFKLTVGTDHVLASSDYTFSQAITENATDVATACPDTEGSPCTQKFTFKLTPNDHEATCTFDTGFTFNFVLSCQDDADQTKCPLRGDTLGEAGTTAAQLQFTIKSSSHCSSVVDAVTLLDNTIDTYSALNAGEGTTEHTDDVFSAADLKDDFLDGQVVYFVANVYSDKASLTASVIDVATLEGTVNGVETTYPLVLSGSNVNNAANTDWGHADVLDVSIQFGGPSTPNADGADKTKMSRPWLKLTLNTVAMGIQQDAIEELVMKMTIIVQYANAGQSEIVQSNNKVEVVMPLRTTGTSSVNAQAEIGVRGPTTSVGAALGDDGEYLGFSQAAVGGAVIAMVAVVAALVVAGATVRARRRAREYTTAGSTTSDMA
jgi:hypothetical protein